MLTLLHFLIRRVQNLNVFAHVMPRVCLQFLEYKAKHEAKLRKQQSKSGLAQQGSSSSSNCTVSSMQANICFLTAAHAARA
jgi:hypothetical protein